MPFHCLKSVMMAHERVDGSAACCTLSGSINTWDEVVTMTNLREATKKPQPKQQQQEKPKHQKFLDSEGGEIK